MECPDCRSALSFELLYKMRCVGCGAKFWFRGGEVIREGETEAVSTRGSRPKSLPAGGAPPAPPPPPSAMQAWASTQGMRAGVYCPACRAELAHEQLSDLVCTGCARRYWQRGAELVPAGETEAIETPDTSVPEARARFRKRDD